MSGYTTRKALRPKNIFSPGSMGFSGDANEIFQTFLFSNHTIGLQLFKDGGLIRSNVQCNSCGRDMTLHVHHCDNSDHFQVRKVLSYAFL